MYARVNEKKCRGTPVITQLDIIAGTIKINQRDIQISFLNTSLSLFFFNCRCSTICLKLIKIAHQIARYGGKLYGLEIRCCFCVLRYIYIDRCRESWRGSSGISRRREDPALRVFSLRLACVVFIHFVDATRAIRACRFFSFPSQISSSTKHGYTLLRISTRSLFFCTV